MNSMAIYKTHGVLILLLILAIYGVLTWVFYEYAVMRHIGDATGINTWGKFLLCCASLTFVDVGLSIVVPVGLHVVAAKKLSALAQ